MEDAFDYMFCLFHTHLSPSPMSTLYVVGHSVVEINDAPKSVHGSSAHHGNRLKEYVLKNENTFNYIV